MNSGWTPPASTSSLINGWTADEVGKLRHKLPIDSTATVLFELTCREPGLRVTFPQASEQAGRTFDQTRADLNQLTSSFEGHGVVTASGRSTGREIEVVSSITRHEPSPMHGTPQRRYRWRKDKQKVAEAFHVKASLEEPDFEET